MSNLSPLASILKENKLTGENYVDWKRNLDIVLASEDYEFVLRDPRPAPEEGVNPTAAMRTAQANWDKANRMVNCYIMASISNVLQTQCEGKETAAEMLTSISGMFADTNRPARQAALRTVMNARMAEGQSVRDHVLRMIDSFNVATTLGAEIDEQSKIDMILESLPTSYG